jgi:hypothetical protein
MRSRRQPGAQAGKKRQPLSAPLISEIRFPADFVDLPPN